MIVTIKNDGDWKKIQELFESGEPRVIQLGKDALRACPDS